MLAVLLLQRAWFVRGLIAQSEPAAGKLTAILNDCCRQLGIRKRIELKISQNSLSPAACGLFNPKIILPSSLLACFSRDELQTAILHELAHIKRGDLWINFLQTVLQIVYFYNPLLWLANAIVRRIREQAVDETVLVYLGDKAKTYSSTLVDIAEIAFTRPTLGLNLIGVVESKKALIHRIKHVTSRPFPKSAKLGFAGLAAIVIIAATLLPMAKANRKDSEVVETKQDSTSVTEFEGKLIFHQDLPGGIIAGTVEHPQLVEVKSIRFEKKYGNAWGVTARVGWSPVSDAAWRLTIEMLDDKGHVLRNSRDRATVFTCKAGGPGETDMLYANLDLGPMQYQRRRHAARFRVRLAPSEEQVRIEQSTDNETHTREVTGVNQEGQAPIVNAVVVVGRSYYLRDTYRQDKTLYPADSQGRCRIRLDGNTLLLVSINAQKEGYCTIKKS